MKEEIQDLPTDDEFLDALYRSPMKPRQYTPLDQGFIRTSAELWLENGVFSSYADAEKAAREMFEPEKSYRGYMPQFIKEEASKYLYPKIPVGYGF